MMELLKKAQLGANLTPAERATLKTMQSLFLSALLVGCLAGGGYIVSGGNLDWRNVVSIVIFAVLASFAHGLAKYVTAHGDLPAGHAIEELAEELAKKTLPLIVAEVVDQLQAANQGDALQPGVKAASDAPR